MPIKSKAEKLQEAAAREAEAKALKQLEAEQQKAKDQAEAWLRAQYPKATMNIVGDEAVIEIEDNGQGLLPFGNNAVNIAAKNTSNKAISDHHHHSHQKKEDKKVE